jgi:hypothetical protein
MKTHSAKRTGSAVTFATAALAALGLTIAAVPAQAKITWITVNDLVDETDVITAGKLCIAVNLGPEPCATVVNGVHFQADRGHWNKKVMTKGGPVTNGVMYWPDFTSGGYRVKMPWQRANGMGNGVTPNAAYNLGLSTGKHVRPGNHSRVNTISGLTPGNTYQIQLWCAHSSAKLVEWDDGNGGREGKGGIFMTTGNAMKGQVATGVFVAAAGGTQTFTCWDQDADPNTTPPLKATWGLLNMLQVRDVSSTPRAASATHYGLGTKGTPRGGRNGQYGGTSCAPAISLTGHPVLGSKVSFTAENSSGAPSSAMVLIGVSASSLIFLQGELLVLPIITLPVPMPFTIGTAMPFTQDHELQMPMTMPATPVTVYVQVLQLDAKAAGGVSFTAGLRIEVGT